MLEVLQLKLLLLLTVLLALISPAPNLGADPPMVQTDYERDLIENIQNQQNNSMSSTGKYLHIPTTSFTAQYPSTYRVDEWVKGRNEARGYTIYIDHYEDIGVLSATTSEMETVPVLKTTIVKK